MTAAEMYRDLKAGSEDFAPYKDRILFRVMPLSKAEEMELARLNLYDMAVVFEIPLGEADIWLEAEEGGGKRFVHNATAFVSGLQADLWEMSPAELYEHALPNTQKARPVKDKPVIDMIRGLAADLPEAADPDLQEFMNDITGEVSLRVVTNENGRWGFAALFYPGVLERLQKKMGRCWIIPASVHEALIMPADQEIPAEYLREVIAWVNEYEVEEADRLSDNLYKYNPETMEIEICRGGEADE